MVDVDTSLTALYVMADDLCQSHSTTKNPATHASLSESEVITLAIFARWSRFASERDFYDDASAVQTSRSFTNVPPTSMLPSRLTTALRLSIL